MDTLCSSQELRLSKKRQSLSNCDGLYSVLAKRAKLMRSEEFVSPANAHLHCNEPLATNVFDLCSELLRRAGHDPDLFMTDPDAVATLLDRDYSPKLVHALFRIICAIPTVSPPSKKLLTEQTSLLRDLPHFHLNPSFHYDSDSSEPDQSLVPHSRNRSSHAPHTTDAQIPTLCSISAAPALPRAKATVTITQAAVSTVRSPVHDDRPSLPACEALLSTTSAATSPQPSKLDPTRKAYNKDTEIALSRIFDLGKVAAVVDTSIPPYAPYHGPSVVCMSGFGELGRFGNQVLQYLFLRVYARRHNISEIQVPAWVGAGLFGLTDRPVQRALPAVTEYRGAKANSTFTDEFLDYIVASNAGHTVRQVGPSELGPDANLRHSPVNVDFWGWFQWHTSCVRPQKSYIQSIFTPIPGIERAMSSVFNKELRYRDGRKRTVVGVHLRLGDYKNISASSFGYCAPTSWYLEILNSIWKTLDDPVLFVASDDIEAVLRDFAAYSPLTADMIGLSVPKEYSELKAGFFPDWWGLTQCDIVAISNSTFSFTACLMNKRSDARFYRAHYADRMIEFDPWNSDPIVHRDMSGSGLDSALSTLKVVYDTQGIRGLVRNMFYEIPYYGIRAGIMKAVLWHKRNTRA